MDILQAVADFILTCKSIKIINRFGLESRYRGCRGCCGGGKLGGIGEAKLKVNILPHSPLLGAATPSPRGIG